MQLRQEHTNPEEGIPRDVATASAELSCERDRVMKWELANGSLETKLSALAAVDNVTGHKFTEQVRDTLFTAYAKIQAKDEFIFITTFKRLPRVKAFFEKSKRQCEWENSQIVEESLKALGRIGTRDAHRFIATFCKHCINEEQERGSLSKTNSWLLNAALRQIANTESEDAVNVFVPMLNTNSYRSRELREQAQLAIAIIGGTAAHENLTSYQKLWRETEGVFDNDAQSYICVSHMGLSSCKAAREQISLRTED